MKKDSIFTAIFLLFAGPLAAADLASPKAATIFSGNGLDVGMSLGVLSASAKEIVYATAGDGAGLPAGARLSQLDWRIKSAPVLGLKLGGQLLPTTRFESSLVLPFSGSSTMTDTDWLSSAYFPNWTDRSVSNDTRLGATFTTDLRLVQRLFAADGFEGHGMLGWRHSQMTWKAYGGSYIYTESSPNDCTANGPATYSGETYRNCIGTFPSDPLISYRQWFDAPYLGVRLTWESGSFRISGDLVGSPYGWSSDRDNHIGQTLFTDRFRQQAMVGANVQASYALSPALAAFVEAEQQTWLKRKGVGDSTDATDGGYSNYGPGSAGISLQTLRLSIGAKAQF